MREEYDFANRKGRKNPYAKRLKKQVTLRLGVDGIELYLRECAQTGKKPPSPGPPEPGTGNS